MPTPRVRTLALALAAALTGCLLATAAPAAADPTPPPNPSDAQIGAAQAGKDALAAQVGSLTAQLTQLRTRVEALQNTAELKGQQYAYAVSQLDAAKQAATTAKQDVETARRAVADARTDFNRAVRANYLQGSLQGGTGSLLTSGDPATVLQSADLQRYVGTHQADGIGRLDRATVEQANADAKARAAVATQTELTTKAEEALQAARTAQQAAEDEQASTAAQEKTVQGKLDTAQATLLGLQNQRAKFEAWKAEQARIAEEKRQAELRRLAQQQAEAAARAAAQAAAAAAANNGGAGGGGGGGAAPSGDGGAPVGGGSPSGGSWTPAMGQQAVNRAMQWLGTPYAWAGGNGGGPTRGVCVGGAAWNDCNIVGFDCSGLVLYGWAPFMSMPHYTVSMWEQMAGSYHPSWSDLMPGDLLFYGGSVGTLHHVAMYIGNGTVIQAPQSGDVVRTTSLYAMGSDYYGAVRPLS